MKVWIVTGVNFGNEESCDYRRILGVFDHEPDNLEVAIIRSDAVESDYFGAGFEDYEIEEFEIKEKQ